MRNVSYYYMLTLVLKKTRKVTIFLSETQIITILRFFEVEYGIFLTNNPKFDLYFRNYLVVSHRP